MDYLRGLLKNIDKTLLILPIFFAIISIVMIASTAYKGKFILTDDIVIQFSAYILGIIAIVIILLVDYKSFEGMEKFIYIFSILLLLSVYIPGFGVSHHTSRAWINLGPIDLQPSEPVKILFVLAFAAYLTRHKNALSTWKGVLFAFLYASPFVLIVIKEDLGGAIVYLVIMVIMIFYAGLDYKIFAKLALGVVVVTPIAYFVMASHQRIRIDAFLHPEDLSLPGNYHVWNSKVAIGSGGFTGKGLFRGTQKELDFLPVQKSDFIFSVIVEELGMIGGAFVIALYTLFLYRIIRIAQNARDMFGALVVIGLLGMFGFQIFENIAMTMGLMPVTGITLPFISYGGSSVVSNMVALGFILNIGIRSKSINF